MVLATAAQAAAYDVELVWTPVADAVGYIIHVRFDGGPVESPLFMGPETVDPDGTISHTATGLPLGPTASFSISSYDAQDQWSGLSNEIQVDYATVASAIDSDGDGLTDAREDQNLNQVVDPGETDPANPDSDGDGLLDGEEVDRYGTNPLAADTDGDGVTDSQELLAGTDPTRPPCEGTACYPTDIYIGAADAPGGSFFGAMRTGDQYADGRDLDPDRDSLNALLVYPDSTVPAWDPGSGDEVHYAVTLPVAGVWYLWARMYYPGAPDSTDANSFWARVDDGPGLRLGNNQGTFRMWHWDGDGEILYGPLSPLSLGQLAQGAHTLVIEKREVQSAPPQLDVLYLTLDPTIAPTDDAARQALGLTLASTTSSVPVSSSTTTSTTLAVTTTTTLPPPPTTLPSIPSTTSTTSTTTTLPSVDTQGTIQWCVTNAQCGDGYECRDYQCVRRPGCKRGGRGRLDCRTSGGA